MCPVAYIHMFYIESESDIRIDANLSLDLIFSIFNVYKKKWHTFGRQIVLKIKCVFAAAQIAVDPNSYGSNSGSGSG